MVQNVGLEYSIFFPTSIFSEELTGSDTILLWKCFMSNFVEPDYKQNLFPMSNMVSRPSQKPILQLNAPNCELIALAWYNWLMHLPDTKSDKSSADNYKLSSGLQTILIANQTLIMLRIYPNILELTKPTHHNGIYFLIKLHI